MKKTNKKLKHEKATYLKIAQEYDKQGNSNRGKKHVDNILMVFNAS